VDFRECLQYLEKKLELQSRASCLGSTVTRVRRSDGRNYVTGTTHTPRTQSGKNGSPQCQEPMRGHPSSKRTKEKREDPGKVSVSNPKKVADAPAWTTLACVKHRWFWWRCSPCTWKRVYEQEKGNGTAGAASPGVVPAVVMPSHRFGEHDLFDECYQRLPTPLNFGYLVACKTRGGDSDIVLIQRIG
jgi:hypothetical protein